MSVSELSNNIIKLTEWANEYCIAISIKYRTDVKELSSDDLLDPVWYLGRKRDEAIRRIKALISASEVIQDELIEYNRVYIETLFSITNEIDYLTSVRVCGILVESQLLEVNRLSYLLSLNAKFFNESLDYYRFLDEDVGYYEIKDGNIYFENDDDIDEMQRRLLSMIKLQEEMKLIDSYSLEVLKEKLKKV
ncbi:MAG TPA: hypothetical protein ENK39_08870 [Epsilonproteobacteria bacterium]|nr:hypothetical protein [Campylobacterota bacterium]